MEVKAEWVWQTAAELLPLHYTNTNLKKHLLVTHKQPFEEVTKEAEYLTASITIVIPIVNALIRQLEKECEDEGIKALNHKLLASLLTRYEDMEENKFFAVPTTLDPRYKL